MNEKLYFLAILPSPEIQEKVTKYKLYASEHFNSSHALKSPPHITLIPPFWWEEKRIDEMETSVKEMIRDVFSFPVQLNGFGCFKPRVIYVDVVSSELLNDLQSRLKAGLKTRFGLSPDKRPEYHPHMTVAFKDLSKSKFYSAWEYFRQQSFSVQFEAEEVTLLTYNRKRWRIASQFSLNL